MKDILICDDEKEIALYAKEYFENFGISADACFDDSFLQSEERYKILLLDINLNNKCGYDIVKKLREKGAEEHIIFISARESEQDIIRGYGVGADDYIVKPFQLNILLMKVKNILNKNANKTLKYREFDIVEDKMALVGKDKIIQMKNQEFKLFLYLYQNRGKIVDKYEIIKNVWGEGYYTENNLNVHIKRLRNNIGDEDGTLIKTIWGKGVYVSMKYIAKISTVLILLVVLLVGVSAFLINKPQPEKIDTVFINEVYNGILKGEYINGKYDYTYIDFAGKVLYESKQTADMSYAERMNNALKNGYAVKEVDSNRLIFYVSNTDYFLSYRKSLNIALICIGVVFLFAVIGYCVYLYLRIIHPFDKLNSFAKNVAGGDLESTLDMSRHNNFGAFEEAFDIMRYNLAKEKKNAQKAEESKKQLMAEIGHDIKTPLMSIRAISEFNLLKNSDSDYKLILDKTNKIDRLISEIYQTALEEMGELSVCATEHNVEEIYKIIKNTDYNGYTNFKNKICDQKVIFDSFRLTQVVENILINSYKYANTEIDISAVEKEEFIDIEFKDYGSGVTESELSHIMDKFYRGEKVLESNGQGLGLYISRKLMNKMDGDLQVCNEGGFKVTIRLKKSE